MNWYKITQSTAKKVSFDFDGTIFKNEWLPEENDYKRDEQGNMTGIINPIIKSLMQKYTADGWSVYIVTSRMEKFKNEVEKVVEENSLPVLDIYCTNGQYKAQILSDLNIQVHYDDDEREVEKIKEVGIRAYLI